VVETEFFLELLMGLLTNSARLPDRGSRSLRQIREVAFALRVETMLAHQPSLFAGHLLCSGRADRLGCTISDPDADGSEAGA